MKRATAAAFLLAVFVVSTAQADTLKIEISKPPVSITVPDDWSPNHSEDEVDGVSPDSSVSFLLYDTQAKDLTSAGGDAINVLNKNGMKVERGATQTRAGTLAGYAATETQYSASEDEQPRQVNLAVALVSGKRYLVFVRWGTSDGLRKNAPALKKIVDSIKVK